MTIFCDACTGKACGKLQDVLALYSSFLVFEFSIYRASIFHFCMQRSDNLLGNFQEIQMYKSIFFFPIKERSSSTKSQLSFQEQFSSYSKSFSNKFLPLPSNCFSRSSSKYSNVCFLSLTIGLVFLSLQVQNDLIEYNFLSGGFKQCFNINIFLV